MMCPILIYKSCIHLQQSNELKNNNLYIYYKSYRYSQLYSSNDNFHRVTGSDSRDKWQTVYLKRSCTCLLHWGSDHLGYYASYSESLRLWLSRRLGLVIVSELQFELGNIIYLTCRFVLLLVSGKNNNRKILKKTGPQRSCLQIGTLYLASSRR